MSLYVLDTDSLTLFQNGQVAVNGRVLQHDWDDLAVTVLTVEEQLGGWYAMLRSAKSQAKVIQAYERLADNVEGLSDIRII